jgi:hypothetical protein
MNLNNLYILENTSKSTNRTLCDSVNKACKPLLKKRKRRKVGYVGFLYSWILYARRNQRNTVRTTIQSSCIIIFNHLVTEKQSQHEGLGR